MSLFSRFPMFIYGGISAYSINYYLSQNKLKESFREGFRAGINDLIKGDSDPMTNEEFDQHYNFYKKTHNINQVK